MQNAPENTGLPEGLIARLARRMARQDLYDSLLMALPPLGGSLFLLVFSNLPVKVPGSILLAAAALLAAALLVRMEGRGAGASRHYLAARLLDAKARGEERFVTLATLEPSAAPSFLMERLRRDAARLAPRVDLSKDFPYRVKRSFLISLIVSLILVLGLRLWPRIVSEGASGPALIRQAAEELSRTPRLAEWARTLLALADRLQEGHLSTDEKRGLIQEILKKMESRTGGSGQEQAGDVLGQAREILQGMERELRKNQGQGGELKTNLPQNREGGEKGSGSGGESGNDQKSAAPDKEGSGGKAAERPERGTEPKSGEGGQGGEKKGGEGREAKKDQEGTAGKGEGKAGSKSKVGEEIPQGRSPDPYGEKAEAGLRDGRFVTVQLPEEESGKSSRRGDSEKRGEVRPKVPLGNAPLGRPDTPDALPERQPMPLEYRGMIR